MKKIKSSIRTFNFISLVLSSMLFYSSMYIILNYIPDYILSLGGTQTDIGLATGFLVLCSLIVRPFVGWIIDHWGRKKVLISGSIIFVVVPFFYGLTNSISGFIAVRMLLGIGLSLFTTAGLTIVTDIVERPHWGEATGYFLSAQLVAISLAPGIGSLVAGPNSLITLIPYASIIGGLSFVMAATVKTIHIPPESKHQFRELNYSNVIAAFIAAVTVGLGYAIIITFLPILMKQNGLRDASLFYFFYALIALIVRAPAGRISDRIGRRILIFPALMLCSIALLIVPGAKSPIAVIISASIYGLGFGSAYPIIGALAADHAPNNARGIAVGFYQGGFDMGLLLGSVGGGRIGQQFGVNSIFLAVSASILVGLIIFFILSMPKRERTKLA